MLNVLSLAVDTAMCGRLEEAPTALAALGFASQVVFLLMVVMMGLTVGTVAFVARAHGAGDRDRARHVLRQSTVLTVWVSAAVALAGNALAGPLLRALGASDAAVAAGLAYLRPLLSGAVFYYLTILLGGALRAVGNTRLPFLVALGSNAVNIFLNYCLILGHLGFPRLGVTGAAISTVASYAVNVAVTATALRRGAVPALHVSLRWWSRIDTALARALFRVGFPAALDMLILNVAFLSIVGMLGRIDELAVAAHGIGLRIQSLAFVPGLAISQATGAMVGNALGAGSPADARQVARASVALCTAVMSTLGFTIVGAAHPIVRVFDVASASPLEAYAVDWMRLLGYCMPLVGVHIAFVGVLQGAGATRTSLAINFAGTALFQVPLGALLGFAAGLGAFGVWLSFPLSFVVKAGLGWLAYARGRWARTGSTA